ncbi:hypothetical protein ACM39_02630 [Chryseobacterium sp. FH2]|uniref:hypothetical protein n=1 Tax=Chryseobacterium sp. FH2 TaxID=1674291 RepID=UPI00065AFA24|nr:hypothetical protein [Chryseobacterium sp. FH2]KMQ69953.1 hypothetical protein ACM39_02630 [Chryseobacterium sp. FH2]
MSTDKTILKSWFVTAAKPTQDQFWAWMDSYYHKNELLSMNSIYGLENILANKAEASALQYLAVKDGSNIENPEQWKDKLDITLLDSNKANKDATELSPENVEAWRGTLGVGNLPENIATNDGEDDDGNPISGTSYTKEQSDEKYYKKVDAQYFNSNYVLLADGTPKAAGDLGKNVANSSLTSIAGAGLTLGADWTMNTSGQKYSVTGLNDVSNDSAFNTILAQNPVGRVGKTNGKQPFLNLPSILSDGEKTAWKTAMNGGWTTNTMSVANVFPNIIKSVNYGIFITINGANLNINPSTAAVSLVDNVSGAETIIPNSQITYGDPNLISIWFKPNTFADGEYTIKIFNGVATVQTSGINNIIITNNANSVDTSTLAWDKLAYTQSEADRVIQINGSTIDFVTNANNKPLGSDFGVVASAKSSQIFTGSDNFSLKGYMILTGNISLLGGGLLGLINSNNSNNLAIDPLVSLKITIEGNNWADVRKSLNEQSSVRIYEIPNYNQVRVDFVISKRDNMASISVNHSTAYNNTTQIYQTVQKTIPEDIPLSIGFKGLNTNSTSVAVKTVLEEVYKF